MSTYTADGEWLVMNGERVMLCPSREDAQQAAIEYQQQADAPKMPLGRDGRPLTAEQQAAAQEAAAYTALDKFVADTFSSRGYNTDGGSLSRYLNMTDAAIAAQDAALQPLLTLYRAECRALDAWYPLVYTYGGAVQTGALPRPQSIEAFIAAAPQIEWPAGSVPR